MQIFTNPPIKEMMCEKCEENKELKSCLKWMMDCYKATLWNKPVKNLDEVFSYAEKLLKED
jgi:hypothetical protein